MFVHFLSLININKASNIKRFELYIKTSLVEDDKKDMIIYINY